MPNPGTGVGSGISMAYEILLDEATSTATHVWEYEGGVNTAIFGDVQRLPNGNTLVNYGTGRVIHQVDPDGNLVQSMTWDLVSAVPYVDWRSSLYGPPDR